MTFVMRSRRVRWAIVLLAAVLVAVGLYWYHRPIDSPYLRAHQQAWQARVDYLLLGRQANASSCWVAQGTLAELSGFGTVESVCWTSVAGHQMNLRFIQKTGASVKELLYMPESNDWRLQYDFCVKQLGGPWWDLRSIGIGCPTGFTTVPAA